MRRRSMAVVFVSVMVLTALSGRSPTSATEAPRARRTSYTVLSRTGGTVRIAALEWIPPRATTVLLALHGLGAVKENSWGPLVVPGYSFALHQYGEGRATVAIDFPGTGESEGNAYLTGVEDFVYVVAQITDILRGRFDHVVGVGHSLGALVVNVAQGVFGSFDAIIPAAYSHGGNSEEFKSACRPPNTPGLGSCPNIRKVLFTSYADPRVVDDYVWRLRAPKPTLGTSLTLYFGPSAGPHLVPTGDEVTSAIDVPVLLILGKDDFVWDTSKYADEPSHYPSAPDVKLVQLPRAGHAVFHHLNHRAVDKVIEDWLTIHKL